MVRAEPSDPIKTCKVSMKRARVHRCLHPDLVAARGGFLFGYSQRYVAVLEPTLRQGADGQDGQPSTPVFKRRPV